MTDYRFRARSTIPGDYNFIAGRLAFLAPLADVKIGVDRGDGTNGTYDPITGNYTDPGKANVLLGHDYIFGGVIQEAEFNEDARNTDPGVANVWNGIVYKIKNLSKVGTKRASSIPNCEAGNIKAGFYIDDVLGTYTLVVGTVGSFAQQRITDLGVFFDPINGFADTAVYTPTGGGARTINILFNKEYDALSNVGGFRYWVMAKTADVLSAKPGETMVIDSVTYKIKEPPHHTGDGTSEIELSID